MPCTIKMVRPEKLPSAHKYAAPPEIQNKTMDIGCAYFRLEMFGLESLDVDEFGKAWLVLC